MIHITACGANSFDHPELYSTLPPHDIYASMVAMQINKTLLETPNIIVLPASTVIPYFAIEKAQPVHIAIMNVTKLVEKHVNAFVQRTRPGTAPSGIGRVQLTWARSTDREGNTHIHQHWVIDHQDYLWLGDQNISSSDKFGDIIQSAWKTTHAQAGSIRTFWQFYFKKGDSNFAQLTMLHNLA